MESAPPLTVPVPGHMGETSENQPFMTVSMFARAVPWASPENFPPCSPSPGPGKERDMNSSGQQSLGTASGVRACAPVQAA